MGRALSDTSVGQFISHNGRGIANMNTTFITGILAIAGLIAAAPVLGAWAQEDSMAMEDTMMESAMMSVTGTVQIGGLFPLDGGLGSYGTPMEAGAQKAVDDFNAYLNEIGADWQFEWVLENTETNAVVALDKIQSLNAKGVNLVVGPAQSSAVKQMKSYVDSNGLILVSPSSTDPSLAIPDDNIFRLVPNDKNQGTALAALMAEEGIKAVVPIWRGETYGDGLKGATETAFSEIVSDGAMHSGVRYALDVPEFSLEVDLLNKYVENNIEKYGAENVAVLIIAFEEGQSIMQSAHRYESLQNVRWFGSEALAESSLLIEDTITSEFIRMVDFTTVQFLLSPGGKAQELKEYVVDLLGDEPPSFTYPSYDAVWVLGLSILDADSTATSDVKAVLPDVAARYSGAMRTTQLNAAGDLDLANYQIWKVVDNVWIKSGIYVAERNILTAAEQPVGEVEVGSLYPLTGRQDATGYHTRDATQLGADHFNAFLDSINAGWKLTLVSEDTATNPNVALEKATTLHSRDIDIIIGPRVSSTTTQVKTYADINDMMLISCCSTAPRLAIPNDSVFRLVPDDFNQAAAVGKLLESEGIEFVIPIWLGDTYGDGLRDATKANFESRGYAFDEGIRFDPEKSEFGSEVSILNDLVQDATETYGNDKVAVFLIAFGQSILILQSAGDYDALDDVNWFIAETLTKKSDVLNDPKTRDFVTRPNVGYTGVQVAESGNDVHRVVESHFIDTIGEVPITLVYHAYDAAWLVGLSILQSGSTDAATIKSVFPEIASQYVGAIGSTTLNEAGDLDKADYTVWSIVDGEWTAIGRYSHLDDSLVNTGADAAPGSG